jgi:hypothetical protein
MQVQRKDLSWLKPAFDVIKRTDPDTYGRMQADYWPVYAVDVPDDIDWVLDDAGPMAWIPLMHDLPTSFGVTISANQPAGMPEVAESVKYATFLYRPLVNWKADDMGVPVPDFLADVLVHEFAHRDADADEPEAFEAGTEFGEKLPASDKPIADLSQAIADAYTPEEYGS